MASIDTTPSAVATSALQSLPFGSLIGGPLKACIDAQTQAAMATWNYIKEVGLCENEEGKRELLYVTFSYRRNGRECTINVPLLTIVPIPYLSIKDIDIAFKAQISAAASTSETKKESMSVDASMKSKFNYYGIVSVSAEISAGFSSKKDSSATRDSKYSVEYTMDVAVKAGQEDMPAGMAKILEMLNESIDTVEKGGELHLSSNVLDLRKTEEDGMQGIYITYKAENGFYNNNIEEIGLKIEKRDNNGNLVEAPKTIYTLTPDDPGIICMFKKEKGNCDGIYVVSAGSEGAERKAQLTVIE